MSEVKTTEKVKLTVSQIRADLANGLDRVAIGQKYGLNKGNVKRLFADPALKGLKVKSAPNFTLVNDTPSAAKTTDVDNVALDSIATKETAKETAKSEW